MSGICGIFNLDGAPVDRAVLERMAASMTFRGPDAQSVWIQGSVGFAHTLLRTTFESEHEIQPVSLDGSVWITADARIDAREELIAELGLSKAQLTRPDCELILHAYVRWGESCVDHLLGDFAFAIWDCRSQKLFCARDHFGIRPFFWARVHNSLVFGNTLDTVRTHPNVTDRLNDTAVCDFLLFGYNQETDTTTFADVRRLPPAQTLLAMPD